MVQGELQVSGLCGNLPSFDLSTQWRNFGRLMHESARGQGGGCSKNGCRRELTSELFWLSGGSGLRKFKLRKLRCLCAGRFATETVHGRLPHYTVCMSMSY